MSKTRRNLLDVFIILLSAFFITLLVSWVAHNILERQASHFAPLAIAFIIPYSKYITWCDIIAVFVAWILGISCNKSLNRLFENFY